MTIEDRPIVSLCRERDDIDQFAADWERLAAAEPFYTPTFSDVRALLEDPALNYALAIARNSRIVTALGLFLLQDGTRDYWLGGRRLLRLPARTASLFGRSLLGAPDSATAAAMLHRAIGDVGVDLVTLDDLPAASSLHDLARSGREGWSRVSHHNTDRRLIALPETMDAYWAAFPSKTRRTALADLRSFERLKPDYRLFTGRDSVTDFLPVAAALSARTYQIHIGQGLVDTPAQRRHFLRLADERRLLCYLACVEGEVVAFGWGELAHGIYYYRGTGYDPAFASRSAGKAILFHMIRDLIERKRCNTFDFGVRDMDYKHRFANTTVPCVHILLAGRQRWRGMLAVGLDRGLDYLKVSVPKLLGAERMRAIKRRLRN